jgi:hypothetical protein
MHWVESRVFTLQGEPNQEHLETLSSDVVFRWGCNSVCADCYHDNRYNLRASRVSAVMCLGEIVPFKYESIAQGPFSNMACSR